MRNLFMRSLVCTLVALFLSGTVAMAQLESGQISGNVVDQSGAVVSGATITVKNIGTNAERTTTSSQSGTFVVTGLPPALYQVTVTSAAFKPYTAKVDVTVASHSTVEARLSVGTATVEISVYSEGGAQVNVESQELSQEINPMEVTQLPSLTRNPYDFVALAGNVSGGDSTQNHAQNGSAYGVGFSINGQRDSGTEILLDGVENIELFGDVVGLQVPVDAVGQYRILTSNYAPEFGRAAGGVLNVVTATGTNQYHGTAWEFNRLSAYTANTFGNVAEGAPKGTYTRNQFGFVASGPIIKNKLFFTASTEWLRVRSSAVNISVVPTPNLLAHSAANVQSFFTTYGAKTFTPLQTFTFADLNANGEAVNPSGPLSLISGPLFETVAFSAPANAGGSNPQNTYNLLGRADWNPSAKTQTYARYVKNYLVNLSGSDFNSPYSQYNVGDVTSDNAMLANATHEFTSSFLVALKASFSRINITNTYDHTLQNAPTLYAATNSTIAGEYIQFPGFYDTNPANGGLPYGGPQNVSQVNPDVTWTKGKHNTKFGAQLLYIQSNRAYGAYAQAGEQLGGNEANGLDNFVTGILYGFQVAVNPKGATPCERNYITGIIQTPACTVSYPASSPSFARSDRFRDWALYAQDAWKVMPKLTLNYGLRWEYFGVQHNSIPALDSNLYYANNTISPINIRNASLLTVPNSPIHSLWNPDYSNYSPRVGVAYDIFGNGKTSFRGGYGISYERNFGNVTFNVIQNPPNYASVSLHTGVPVTNSNFGPMSGTTGSFALPPSSPRNVNQNIKTARTQFWSGAIEHQLFRSTVLAVEYSGAKGDQLYDIRDVNGVGEGQVLLGDPVGPAGQLSRVNDHFTSINTRGSEGASDYDAINFRFQTQNLASTGLSLTANYTYGHSLDDLSSTFSATNNAFSLGYTEPWNPGFDHGSSDFDLRHRLGISSIYQIPYFKNRHDLKGETLGGWEVTGIYTARTGTPFTYFDSTNVNGGGDFLNIPRYAPSTPLTKKQMKYKTPSAASGSTLGGGTYIFGTLPQGTVISNPALGGISDWGPFPSNTLKRNSFEGPGAWNIDASLSKKFPITDRINVELRAEAFDLTNHHNFYQLMATNDQGNYTSGAPLIKGRKGGVNGGASDERRFGQFALKVNF